MELAKQLREISYEMFNYWGDLKSWHEKVEKWALGIEDVADAIEEELEKCKK